MARKILLIICSVLLAFGLSVPAFANSGMKTLYTKVDTPMYAQADLNSSLVVNTIWKGSEVDALEDGKVVNGFIECQYEVKNGPDSFNFIHGYIPAVHLSEIKNANNGGGGQANLNGTWECAKKITQDTWMKKEPSTASSALSSLPAGTNVTVHTVTDGWAKIDYGRNAGYVATCYLEGWNTPENYPEDTTSWYDGYDWSNVYDYAYYAQNNPDVTAALGNTPEACISHFVKNGIHEGRQGNRSFDVKVYMDQHPEDVRKYGTTDLSVYYKLVCGIPF